MVADVVVNVLDVFDGQLSPHFIMEEDIYFINDLASARERLIDAKIKAQEKRQREEEINATPKK